MTSLDGGTSAHGDPGTRENKQGTAHEDREERQTSQWKIEPILKEHIIGIPDDVEANARSRRSYASFGDHGTTASVNAYGHIMQISSFLGYGDSGFLSVDLHDTPEPYYVQSRMERLMEISEQPKCGIRLETQENSDLCWDPIVSATSLEFVYDRWPRFTKVKSPENSYDLDFSVEYFCEGGTVFQTYTWQLNTTDSGIPELPQFIFDSRLLVRELDFVVPQNTFNSKNKTQTRKTICSQQALRIFHEKSDQSITGLVVAPFAFGENQKILPREDSEHFYRLDLSENAKSHFRNSGALQITMAYKLESRSAREPFQEATDEDSQLKSMENTQPGFTDVPYQRIAFSSHKHLDFVIRRNLEHILSVCSIPVPEGSENGDMRWAKPIPMHEEKALALTCGDISGHWITSSASFYAFQFLIAIYQYVGDESKLPRDYFSGEQKCESFCMQRQSLCQSCNKVNNYLQHLQQRIWIVCKGHLHWVYKNTELEDGTFGPHYWVTGKRIPWESHEFMTPRSLTDTPFQLLKIRAFLFAGGLGIPRPAPPIALNSLRPQILSWVQTLENDDERGKFVFPRPSKDESKTFFLADHFWIYQAVKFVFDELRCWIPARDTNRQPNCESREPNPYIDRKLFPTELRQTMIHRFITVNPDSGNPTIATARTSTETKFQFHPTDTSLLYAMDMGFFEKPPEKRMPSWKPRALMEEWKTTLNAQGDFEENQTLYWDNPLQYALALIMNSKKPSTSSKSLVQVIRAPDRVLLKSTSPNGLFPGLLGEEGEPTMFQDECDRDKFWHATFEVPHILWMYAQDHFEFPSTSDTLPTTAVETKDDRGLQPSLRAHVPFSNFNSVIEEGGVFDFSDDWLQESPRFLDFRTAPRAFCFQQIRGGDGVQEFLSPDKKDLAGACETLRIAEELYRSTGTIGRDNITRGDAVDIPKKSCGYKVEPVPMTNDKIFRFLAKRRKVQDAKKRLVWLPRGDKITALMCYLASPGLERDSMSAFIDRHTSYDKFFFDGVAPFQNEWETELHLSYFSLSDQDPGVLKKGGTIPYLSYVAVGKPPSWEKGPTEVKTPKTLVRSTMGFRFVGDFSDRYWTCHVLEFNPKYDECQESLKSLLHKSGIASIRQPEENYEPRSPWQQRRVLELLIFDQMLKRIRTDIGEILSWVRSEVSDAPRRDGKPLSELWPDVRRELERSAPDEKTRRDTEEFLSESRAKLSGAPFELSSTYPLNPLAEALHHDIRSKELKGSDGYFSRAKFWAFFETILQTVEDDLEENLEKIEKWSLREEDRGFHKPRWTRNDERRYGSVIKTLLFQTQSKIHELHRLKRNIRAFREPRSSKVSSLRDDINLLGTENVNLFTYVTVIFLPLGFATGIFSMSNPPGTETLVGMLLTAIVAFHLTIGALVNAKPLINFFYVCSKTALFYPVYSFFRFVYLPITDTWLGSRVLRVFEAFRDRAEGLRIFDEAQKGYNARTERGRNNERDNESRNQEERGGGLQGQVPSQLESVHIGG